MLVLFAFSVAKAQDDFEKDVIETSAGDLEITFIGHGTLMFKINDLVIHVDPVPGYADYAKLPKAGIVLITHQHGDHLSREALDLISISNTDIIVTEKIFEDLNKGIVMNNWDNKKFKGLEILAVPAYNLVHTRNDGSPYHPKGEGNGYVISFGNKKVYIGGDTENFPEMKDMPQIDIAFLPMNLPYTMTPEMVAAAAKVLQPAILYPYHYGETDPNVLYELLNKEKNIQIRIRDMK
jgi:L-ascorbate metabolism protein UlaG (beta-lactamase superfamily)